LPITTLWHVTLHALQDWWGDNCLRLAASLAPLVLLIVGLAGLVLDQQQVARQLTAQLEGLMGPAGRELVTSILTTTTAQGGTVATTLGLLTLLIGATAVFGELQVTLNLIWEGQSPPPLAASGRGSGLCSGSGSSRWPLSSHSRPACDTRLPPGPHLSLAQGVGDLFLGQGRLLPLVLLSPNSQLINMLSDLMA
jgi:hypothetical protein